MPSAFLWPVLVPYALRAPAPVNLGVSLHEQMHEFIATVSEPELRFIASCDYGQDQEKHFLALHELIFKRKGAFTEDDVWFPYEVIELCANSIRGGHERAFAISALLVVHAVESGFDTWTDISDKFSKSIFSTNCLPSDLANLLLEECLRVAR